MWVRLMKAPDRARVRILDVQIREYDRKVYLWGVIQKQHHIGWANVDLDVDPHADLYGDCWLATMNTFGEITKSVVWDTVDTAGAATEEGVHCKNFAVQQTEDNNAIIGIGTRMSLDKTNNNPLDAATTQRQLLIMKVDDIFDQTFAPEATSAKIWSQSPD